jgi:hypothetical protein
MSNNLLLAAVIGAAVFLVVKKQGQAAVVNQGGYMTPAQMQVAGLTAGAVQTANMNGDMWKSLLGAGFASVAGSGGASGLLKNIFGQTSTSDGKPIMSDYGKGEYIPVLTGAPSTGVDYLGGLFPTTDTVLGWGNSQDISYSDDLMGLF